MTHAMKAMVRSCWERPAGVIARLAGLRSESGQSLVELSLGLTAMTVLLIGATEFGGLAYASIEVSNAARAGVQYGAQNHTTASDTTGMQTAATQDAPDV